MKPFISLQRNELGSFENFVNKFFASHIYFLSMYKQYLALNNLQWLIHHKTQPNQIIYLIYMYKQYLALNNLQWLICHKSKPNQSYHYLWNYLIQSQNFFTLFLFLIWFSNLFPKNIILSEKKFNSYMDLICEICIDSKFSLCWEIPKKKCLP